MECYRLLVWFVAWASSVRPRVGRTTFSYCPGLPCTNGQGYNTAQPGISLEDDPRYPSRAHLQALAHQRSIISNLNAQPEVGSASRALLASKSGYSVGCTQSRVLLTAVPLAGPDMHEVICHHHQNSGGLVQANRNSSSPRIGDPFPS